MKKFLFIIVVIVSVIFTSTIIFADKSEEVEIHPLFAAPPTIVNYFKPDEDTYVVNFFASWCKPCRLEIPYLEEIQKTTGIIFYGIVVRDEHTTISSMLEDHEIKYKKMGYNLPLHKIESIEIDRIPRLLIIHRGEVVYDHEGEINKRIMKKKIVPLLSKIKQNPKYW
jgi:thiol-disulfide isomerase/thioredoxin